MGPLFRALCVAALLSSAPLTASAADIGRLEWGGFVVEADSSNGYQEINSSTSDDGRSLTLTFSALEAKADGSTMEATAKVAGHYDVSQPKLDSFVMARVNLEGHIIKSTGSVAKLVLKVGGSEKIIEWPEGNVASEKYTRAVEIALPAGGRLPNPFPVSVDVLARKTGYSDAVYVSVSGLTITAIEEPKVASN